MHNVKSFPDAYDKQPSSNLYKLMQLNYLLSNDVKNIYAQIEQSRGIENAYGKTLVYYGEMVGQDRNGNDDEQYRIMILNRIAQKLSNGDCNSVISLISQTFNIDKSQIWVNEGKASVRIAGISQEKVESVGLTVDQIKDMIKGILPIGVKLEYLDIQGTLIMTNKDIEDKNGLGDIAGTVGGTLGWIY